MSSRSVRSPILIPVLALLAGLGCEPAGEPYVDRPPPPAHGGIYSLANGCYAVDATAPGSTNTRWLEASESGDAFSFSAMELAAGARFFLRASDLGTYLFYDAEGRYLVVEDGALARTDTLLSDILLIDDTYRSPAEWEVEVSSADPERFQLRHYQSGRYLTRTGPTDDVTEAAVVAFYPQTGCAEFPELTLDAEGEAEPRTWPDGDLFGIVESHSHPFTNFGFGGGGMFHGAPFHRLGVEHALPSCEPFHGVDGRRDLIGYAFSGFGDFDTDALLNAFLSGRTPEFNPHTEGHPGLPDGPNAWGTPPHQTHRAGTGAGSVAWGAGRTLAGGKAVFPPPGARAPRGIRVRTLPG